MAVPKNNLYIFKKNLKKNKLKILEWKFEDLGTKIIEKN